MGDSETLAEEKTENKVAAADMQEMIKKMRFNMSYLHAHKLNESARWLGELLLVL